MTTSVYAGDIQSPSTRSLLWVMRLTDYIFGIIYTLTLLDFSMEALRASETNSLKKTIDNITDPFIAPFIGLFPNFGSEMGNLILSYVMALAVFVIIHTAIRTFLSLFLKTPVALANLH